MRLANNKLKTLIGYFHSELKEIYGKDEIDAIVALAAKQYLGFSQSDLLTKANENVNQSDLLKLYDCCKALKRYEPAQYVLGESWFYNLRFFVNKNVLIPRPETEELADIVITENKNMGSFLDIGTGSGCLAVAIKKNIPAATVCACDISVGALQTAAKNLKENEVDVALFEANVLNREDFVKKAKMKFDVIVSNPPYILAKEKNAIAKNVSRFEPQVALFVSGEDHIVFYRKIIDLCSDLLNPQGRLYFELNPITAEEVLDYANKSGQFKKTELLKDMSGNVRFFKGEKV